MDAWLPMFLPLPIPLEASARGHRLEQELAVCQSLLGVVLEHLGRTLRPEDRDTPLARLVAQDDPAKAEQVAEAVDGHLAAKREDLALRVLREETALTWDDLYLVVHGWPKLPAERKRRWVRFARLGRALRAMGGGY